MIGNRNKNEAVSKVLAIAIPMDIGRSNLVIRAMKAHRDHFTPFVMTDYLFMRQPRLKFILADLFYGKK
ncbi:hypothetical protein Echvi_0757 [Echinicola vietnamensis DSM 17526]|uniref:Uncharacterized protein n=1 Tax=Echinicola vietnamensis (strain DSM 17526 / LMG 23754 / KMM 6221) TaxID=926556 RepID=L0FUS2_ECHVK|nr:hypothetical protein Echvi_0757 [Echinicola vietnamensis DSM 17526]